MEAKVNLGTLFKEAMKREQKRIGTRRIPREWNNQSGFFKVTKIKCKGCKKGYTWLYRISTPNGEHRITRTDLLKLKNDVKSMGFRWYITDEQKAQETAKKANLSLDVLR